MTSSLDVFSNPEKTPGRRRKRNETAEKPRKEANTPNEGPLTCWCQGHPSSRKEGPALLSLATEELRGYKESEETVGIRRRVCTASKKQSWSGPKVCEAGDHGIS